MATTFRPLSELKTIDPSGIAFKNEAQAAPWLNESISANGRSVQENFARWFGKSQILGADGAPLVIHHGTGAKIDAFDPALTGLGNDQFGSGFYFTTEAKQAKGYQSALASFSNADKLGGTDFPNTISAFLRIEKPIHLTVEQENLRHVVVTPKQAHDLLKMAPGILHPHDSPLTNWFDNDGKPFSARQVRQVAAKYKDLMSIENDFFSGEATTFRHAVQASTGFDGVEKTFADGTRHLVAWFPEQVKSIDNAGLFLSSSPSLTDEDAALALKNASKGKVAVDDVQAALDLSRALKARESIMKAKKGSHHAHALA